MAVAGRTLVAGVDSSTQSCKVVIRDAVTGELVRSGRAAHPEGTEVAPEHWWQALHHAIEVAGGIDDVAALSIGGQQHGMVCLDEQGEVVRDALLWNDTRSATAAADLIEEFGGTQAWADAVGSVPVASYTVTKLRWLLDHEPRNAARTTAVCLPHDWLTWKLLGSSELGDLITDRSDASGTGYWSAQSGYRTDLVALALGHEVVLPRVLAPNEPAGQAGALLLGPGAGDNAAAALGLNAVEGDVIVSIGTSGVVSALSTTATHDTQGLVSGFASAIGTFLPLVATLNAARILDAGCELLSVGHAELSRLALSAPAGAGGLTLVPYFEGERTPNRPEATASLHGMRLANINASNVARAHVEGLLCLLADGLDALLEQGASAERVILIGGGANSAAVRAIAPAVLDRPVIVPAAGEYVADGAARQAAWTLAQSATAPVWPLAGAQIYKSPATPSIRTRYAEVRDMIATR